MGQSILPDKNSCVSISVLLETVYPNSRLETNFSRYSLLISPTALAILRGNPASKIKTWQLTRNWRGVPLETLEIVVNLIANTRTTTRLEVHAWLDEKIYQKVKEISDEELKTVKIFRNKFHGEWNFEIHPAKTAIR